MLDEVYRIIDEPGTEKYGVGQSLYYQIPLFCNPAEIIPDYCWTMIEDYSLATKFNASIGDLDSLSTWRADCFLIIESEINKCTQHKQKKNNG